MSINTICNILCGNNICSETLHKLNRGLIGTEYEGELKEYIERCGDGGYLIDYRLSKGYSVGRYSNKLGMDIASYSSLEGNVLISNMMKIRVAVKEGVEVTDIFPNIRCRRLYKMIYGKNMSLNKFCISIGVDTSDFLINIRRGVLNYHLSSNISKGLGLSIDEVLELIDYKFKGIIERVVYMNQMTKWRLAIELGISPCTLSNIIKSKKMGYEIANKLSKFSGINIIEISKEYDIIYPNNNYI
jgi:hypothetical protein